MDTLMHKPFDKPLKGESLAEYLNRHHAGLDDPLNEGITDEELMADGTLAKPDDPVYGNAVIFSVK